MRFLAAVLPGVLVLIAGCAPPHDARKSAGAVPALEPPGEGYEVVGGDLVVDDTLGIHVVFALGRPGLAAQVQAQVQYARGLVGADTVVWKEPRLLETLDGERPRVVLTDRIHVIAGERLHHLSSTDGGRGFHDHGEMIPADSSWSTSFDVVTRGGSVHVASLERPSLPDAGTRADGRIELRAHAWRKGTATGQLLSVHPMDGGGELATAIAVVDSALEITCSAGGPGGSHGFVRWSSANDGLTWTRSAAGLMPATATSEMETGPGVLARRTARARTFTLTSRRGEPRVFLDIRPIAAGGGD